MSFVVRVGVFMVTAAVVASCGCYTSDSPEGQLLFHVTAAGDSEVTGAAFTVIDEGEAGDGVLIEWVEGGARYRAWYEVVR